MIAWLNKPYPQIESIRLKIAISVAVGIMCFIFLLVFKPFGLDQTPSASYIFGFGVNAFLSLIITLFVLPLLFKSFFKPETWTIGREAIFFIIVHLIIAILNFVYNTKVGGSLGSVQYSLIDFVYMTVAVGFFPMSFMIIINERLSFWDQHQLAVEINNVQQSFLSFSNESKREIHIQSDNISEEDLKLSLASFVYATSSNNYCNVYFLNDKRKMEHRLMRVSLKNLDKLMTIHEEILRVHKSYLVNKIHIAKAEGNARSLYLLLNNTEVKVPVSRTFDRTKLTKSKSK